MITKELLDAMYLEVIKRRESPDLIITSDPDAIQKAKELGFKMSPVENVDGVWYISNKKEEND